MEKISRTDYIKGKSIWHLCFMLGAMLVLGTVFQACESLGGAEGEQGPQGEVGPIGPAGEDGSMIFAGEGMPAADLGNIGDFYLNKETAELYGPKDELGWGMPISLKGSDGQDGEDGSQIFSGTAVPDVSIGSIGDYYLHTVTFELYGPKTESGWGTPISLKGTANVLYSSWLDIDWNLSNDSTFQAMSIPESRITDKFLDEGVIKMYLNSEASNNEGSLRITYPLPLRLSSSYLSYSALITIGEPSPTLPEDFAGIVLSNDANDGETVTDLGALSAQVRYVLIPGGQQLKAKVKVGQLIINLGLRGSSKFLRL